MTLERIEGNEGTDLSGDHNQTVIDRINAAIDQVNVLTGLVTGNDNIKFTDEGGLAISLLNKTGSASVKGTVLISSTSTDSAVAVAPGDSYSPMGVMYESGIADGEYCWVVVSGLVDVLIKDGTAAVHGNWVGMSDTNGRADATSVAPPDGGLLEGLIEHMKEIGKSMQSKSSGTDVLCRCNLHFN